MTYLLEKNTPFIFSEDCIKAFQTLKKKLTEAPILIALNWDLPFELMCDASDFAIGAVLGQRHKKHFRPIHYASKMMNDAETNYTTTEKEMLAVVYAFEKFWSYLIMNKSIVHTDHSALRRYCSFGNFKAGLMINEIEGTLPGNTVTNPKEELKGITTRSGVAYQGPKTPSSSKRGTKVTKDQVQTPSSQNTAPVQPSVIQSESQASVFEPVVAPVSAPMP
nr:reverse transcriptase domain-containing protein [Tanacetum cinerariifolium]